MNRFNLHYKRSIDFFDTLTKNKIPEDIESISSFSVFALEIIKKTKTSKTLGHVKMFNEISQLEEKKYAIRTDNLGLQEIKRTEWEIYIKRQDLLEKGIEKLWDDEFIINPFVNVVQTNWKWQQMRSEVPLNELFYLNLLDKKGGDFYTIFKTTGFYFESIDSNILEIPINEYHHFLIQSCMSPIRLGELSEFFKAEFDTYSQPERIELDKLTNTLLNELIFRTYLIRC